MKRINRRLLALLLCAALLIPAALAGEFNAGLDIVRSDDTIAVTVQDSDVLHSKKPNLTIPCPGWANAAVTGPDGGAVTSAFTDEAVTFQVARGGTYTITKRDAEVTPDPTPTPTPSISRPTTTTTTEQKEDGTVTKTVTDRRTGTVTATTTEPDGTTTVVETKKDGSSTTTVDEPDGTKTVVEVQPDGSSTTSMITPDGVETYSSTTAEGETTAQVTVPETIEAVKVTIPTPTVGATSVAVIVHADGTEELIRMSAAGEGGMALRLEGSASIKIVERPNSFEDVTGLSCEESAAFVAARGLFQGTSATTFEPETETTRGMLTTVLFRLNGERKGEVAAAFGDVEEDIWYADAVAWAAENQIVNGYSADVFAPEDPITWEQMMTMIHRYVKRLGLGADELPEEVDLPFDGEVSDWAYEAVCWFSASGIADGESGIVLRDHATRAEVAILLEGVISYLLK